MPLRPKQNYSFQDYLAAERACIDIKHEYVAGEVFAMTGASYEHNLIVGNILAGIHSQLKDRPCTVQTADMRVRIQAAEAATYPDIVVLCDEPLFHDKRRDTLTNPTLIVEVLSKSTEAYDRGGKFAIYRALPSLRQYVLVAQDRVSLDLYTRESDNRWVLTAFDKPEDRCPLDSIRCTLSLAEVYDKVRFEEAGFEPAEGIDRA